MAVGGGLQIAVKRRHVKSKGEKERYKHLNAEFQRIARIDKKAFLSDQCKVNLYFKVTGLARKEMWKSKMAVWGGLTNSCEKKRSKRQRRKGKIYPFECTVSKNNKER